MSSTPFQIPPPPAIQQRLIVQPSLHARGARPYVFTGAVDEWHAPGADVSVRSGTTRAAVDAAWLCERVLGAAHTSAARWPGVVGAREHVERIAAMVGSSPYQVAGSTFLAERDYACLFDQMGLGKTQQALIAAEARLAMSVVPTLDTPAVLIVCPALAKYSWKREIERWLGYEAAIIDGLRVTEVPRARYIITNYDILYGKTKRDAAGVVHDLEHLTGWGGAFAQQGFAVVILDEAHMLRGRQSRRTHAVKKMCKRVPIVWALTGTPMPNYVRDVWAMVDVVSDGLFGFSYWSWAKKYCLDPKTPMLLADGTYKKAGKVRVGDRLLGWQERWAFKGKRKFAGATVLAVQTRWASRYRLTMESGQTVVTSSDHKWFTGRSEEPHAYRSVLGLRNRPLRELMVAAPPPSEDVSTERDYRIGYIRGLLDGDGYCSVRPKHRTGGAGHACVIGGKDDAHLERAADFAPALGLRTKITGRRKDGCRIVGFYTRKAYALFTAPLGDETRAFKLGWLAGMYDAEGSQQNLIAQVTSEEKRQRINKWLKDFGFKTQMYKLGVKFHGGRYALLRFWQLARPVLIRKLDREVIGTANLVHHTDRIARVEKLSRGRVVSVTTSTGNYIANGYMSKNCGAALGQYGWKDTGSAYPEELSARLGYFCLGRSSASVALELPEKRREVLKLDVTMTATTRHEGAVAMANKASFVASALRATACAKRPAAIEQIVEAVQAGQKVVAYTYMREQADEIAKAVKAKVDAPVFAVHGDMTPQGRDQQAGVFRDTTGAAAFVATIDSVGVAISLVGADLVLYCDLVPEPWKLLQSEKRAHRRGSTKRVIVRYLIGVGTLDEGVVESVIDKLAAIEASLGNEADQGELVQQLGGNVRSDESIIDGLFARLVGGST